MRARLGLAALLAALALLDAGAAAAQAYPTKPVRWIVPFPAGGPADILARIIAEPLSARLGQPVIIDNKAGASGIIGTEIAVKAPPDGYTIITGIASTITNNQFVTKMTYDPAKDLAPISLLTRGYLLLLVRAESPATSLQDFVERARSQPGKLNYGTWGNGSATHLATELLKRRAGIDLTHIPYKGSAPVLTDLIAGQIDVTFETTNPAIQYVRAGKLRAIAISAPARTDLLPAAPAIAELYPGFQVATWGAVLAPLGTPPEIIERLSSDFQKVMREPAVRTKLIDLGTEPAGTTAAELAETIRQDVALWSKVIQDAGITAD